MSLPSSSRHRPSATPSKRKLDDYAASSSFPNLLKMRKSSSSSSDPILHFFVRTGAKTLVLHAHPLDTVSSLLDQIRAATGIPASDQRLIYRGRQLDDSSTLAASSVETDSSLHLTGRLRSTKLPRSFQLVSDLLSAVELLLSSAPPSTLPSSSSPDSILREFLSLTPTGPGGQTDDKTLEHLRIFLLACAPAALVKLYLSPLPANRTLAERTISLFLRPSPDFLPANIHAHCSSIVLDFCKLIAGTVGKSAPLYATCRNTLSSLLEGFGSLKNSNLVSELYPFLAELAGIIGDALMTDAMDVPADNLSEFSNFLVAIRRAIQDWMGAPDPIPESLMEHMHPMYEGWISSLYEVYAMLVEKVDHCFKIVEEVHVVKGMLRRESQCGLWSHFLVILTNLNSFSKIFESAPKMLHRVLLDRRMAVNALIRREKRNEKLKWLLKYKDVTDFESRRNLTMMLFPDGKDDYEHLHEMLIDRSQLLAESFEYIGCVEAHNLHGGLFMEFKNEEATGPGVLREWFSLVCKAIFNPQNVLFLPCPNDRRRFFPNPASVVDPLHLKYFSFCGRVTALALMHKVQVGFVFDRTFFLQLAGKDISLEDVRDADPCLYMSCKKFLEMDAELLDSDVLGLTFVREIEELGTQRAVELCPGGKDTVVDSKNREEYINLLIQHRFVISVSEQLAYFARGFSDILSNSKLQKFFFHSLDLEDFDRMLGGSDGIISARDWKAHTEYDGYKAKDRQICWFWKIVEGMPEEQQRVLLFFWTSVKYLPVDGFGGLASKLYIYKGSDSHDHLPSSHTCFYRLCLPSYPSISVMRDRLQLITQEHVSCSFGMW